MTNSISGNYEVTDRELAIVEEIFTKNKVPYKSIEKHKIPDIYNLQRYLSVRFTIDDLLDGYKIFNLASIFFTRFRVIKLPLLILYTIFFKKILLHCFIKVF